MHLHEIILNQMSFFMLHNIGVAERSKKGDHISYPYQGCDKDGARFSITNIDSIIFWH